ncbi:MAG: hypothetical protein Q7S91_01495 [Aquabacterium sp.]|nr:hypothetical protein [Aquabacterium sp.]
MPLLPNRVRGGKLHGNFGAVVDGQVFQSTVGQPVKEGGLMFERG